MIPSPELKRSYIGVEADTIFQNNLVDFKIRKERKKYNVYSCFSDSCCEDVFEIKDYLKEIFADVKYLEFKTPSKSE